MSKSNLRKALLKGTKDHKLFLPLIHDMSYIQHHNIQYKLLNTFSLFLNVGYNAQPYSFVDLVVSFILLVTIPMSFVH